MFQASNQQRNYYSDAPSMIHDHLSAPKEVIPERQGYDRVAKKDIGNALILRCIAFTATGPGRDCTWSVAASINP